MNMSILPIVIQIVLFLLMRCSSTEFHPERAKVTYFNPKYVANVSAVTRRVSRHEPYRTNLTATLLAPFGNNVTFALILRLKSGGDFKIVSKVCDTMKTKWMQKYMSQYTNLTLSKCPFPAGTYAYMNMELPPRNVPVPVMDGDYYIIMEFSITTTKEKVLTISTLLRFDELSAHKKTEKNRDRNNKKG